MALSKQIVKIVNNEDALSRHKQGITLIDIFSFSCMNCRRSLKYITKIAARYKKYGLKTIITHVPEWQFEKNQNNIMDYMKKSKVSFPSVIDSKKNIIKSLGVNFWPTQIITHKNKIVYKHIGEGNYKHLEDVIRKIIKAKPEMVFSSEPRYSRYECIYLGKKKQNKPVLKEGKWSITKEYAEGSGKITFSIRCKSISIVAEAKKRILIYLKAKHFSKSVAISKPDLYHLHTFNADSQRKFDLIIKKPVKIYSIVPE